MRRLLALTLALLLCALLALPAAAESSFSSAQCTATVSNRGQAQVLLQFHLSLDQTADRLVFPLGDHVSKVTVNGAAVRLKQIAGVRSAVLTSETGFAGELDFTIAYTQRQCVSPETGWKLVLPLLPGGLDYPIDQLSFAVTMPDAFTETPVFSSGYYGEDVDNFMTVTVSGPVISGKLTTTLKDHETLTLSMDTDPAVFPRNHTAGQTLSVDRMGILVCALAAAAYWLLRLRTMPRRVPAQPQPPADYTAGELVSRLGAGPTDLPLMTATWAQLGYLTIHMAKDGSITLHRLMDMGNERSAFEQRTFAAMFGRGAVVSAASGRFRSLCREVQQKDPGAAGQFLPKSGKPWLLRGLCLIPGLLAGVAAGDLLAPSGVGRWPIPALGGAVGLVCAWLLQRGVLAHLRPGVSRRAMGAAAALALLVGGAAAGSFGYSLAAVVLSGAAAWLTLYGGRRSEAGQRTLQTALGLRRYCKTVERNQLRRIVLRNPGYYYDLAPYALALGVDREFALQFESMRQPQCVWLVSDLPRNTTAAGWYPLLREAMQTLRTGVPRRSDWEGSRKKRRHPRRPAPGRRP